MKQERYWCDMCAKEIPDRQSGHTIAVLTAKGQCERMAHNLVFDSRYSGDYKKYKANQDFALCDECHDKVLPPPVDITTNTVKWLYRMWPFNKKASKEKK